MLDGKLEKDAPCGGGIGKKSSLTDIPHPEVDKENLKGKLVSIPERAQIPLEINETLIMEHYTRYT
jgi:ribosomal protein S4